jgi:accessory gene regulator protein AgrB
MTIQVFAVILSVGVFLFVIELVRRERLTFRYAIAWLFFAGLGVVCSIFKEALFTLSQWFGFELPSNFIFFGLLCVFVFLSLLLTVFLCQQHKRNDRMVQALGLLELEIKKLKERVDGR